MDLTVFWCGAAALLFFLLSTGPSVLNAYRFVTETPPPDGRPTIGVDFFINWAGSYAWAQGVDPYDNEKVAYSVIESGRAPVNYLNRVLSENFPRHPVNPQYMGFVSLPSVLWLLRPLSTYPFGTAMLIFWTLSVAIYLTVIGVFVAKSFDSGLKCVGAVMMAWAFFLGLDTNLRNSLQLGQIDALYLAPLGVAVYLFAFAFERRAARYVAGCALGIATAIKGFPALVIFLMLGAAMVQAYRCSADSSGGRFPRVKSFVRSPAVDCALGWATTLGALGWWTYQTVGYGAVSAWQGKMAVMANLPQLRLTLTPDLRHYLSYWLRVAGIESPTFSSLLMASIAIPVAILACRRFADAAASPVPSVRFLGIGTLVAVLPILNIQHADYYNLIIMLPIIASISPKLPIWDLPWRRFVPTYAALVVGYVLINTEVRQSLMPMDIQDWWFAARAIARAEVAFYRDGTPLEMLATPDALLGGFAGSALMAAALMHLLKLALICSAGNRERNRSPHR